MIQWILAIWSLVPLPFLNLVCTSGSSRFTYCWFLIEGFEHYLASLWNDCNCVIVWTFISIALLWDWNENWPFPVLWPLLNFPNFLQHHSSKESIFWHSAFFFTGQHSYPYMTTWKTIALTIWIFVGKVMSLLFNTLSRITFLSRSKHLLIS